MPGISPFPEISHANWEAMLTVASALREIRDKRLYRETHSDFYAYCLDTFGIPKHLIDTAFDHLAQMEN